MGAGITLAVIGAVLAFALRVDSSVISLPITGAILMLAGALLIWNERRKARRAQLVTRLEQTEPGSPPTVVVELIQPVDYDPAVRPPHEV